MLRKQGEVMRFAKERGEIGGEGIGERLPFCIVTSLEQGEVFAESLQTRCALAPRLAAIHQLLLALS